MVINERFIFSVVYLRCAYVVVGTPVAFIVVTGHIRTVFSIQKLLG